MIIFEFVGSLLLCLISSAVLARRIEQLGVWLGVSELLLGLLTAFGADAPEIASSISSIVAGHHELGIAVVLGSNLFNLAALLGLSAALTGNIRVHRGGLLLNGIVALLVTVLVIALMMGALSMMLTSVLLAIVLLPYFVLSSLKPAVLVRTGLPWLVARNMDEASRDARPDSMPSKPSTTDILSIVPHLAMVVIASIGMVHSAVAMGQRWKVPHLIIGTLVLASLTGIPNVVAALRLAWRGRASAVFSETLNSNTFNLLAGAYLPALFLGTRTLSRPGMLAAWWLLALTGGSLILSWVQRGMSRPGGIVVLIAYALFVASIIGFG